MRSWRYLLSCCAALLLLGGCDPVEQLLWPSSNWWERGEVWAVVAVVWLGVGFICAGGLRRRRRRRRRRAAHQDDHGDAIDYGGDGADGLDAGDALGHGEGLDAVDLMISLAHVLFAPLTLVYWLLLLVIELIGAVTEVVG